MKLGKALLILVLGIVGVIFAWKVLSALVGFVLSIAIPAAIAIGVIYVVYRLATKEKSLPGSGRPLP